MYVACFFVFYDAIKYVACFFVLYDAKVDPVFLFFVTLWSWEFLYIQHDNYYNALIIAVSLR